MPSNGLPPAWVQLNYTSNGHQHRALLPCAISGAVIAGTEPEIVRKVGSPDLAGVVVGEYANIVKQAFNTGSTIDSYFVFSQPTPTSVPVFVWSDVLGIAGTSASALQPGGEMVVTFKTPHPGGLKIYLMETVFTFNIKQAQPIAGPSFQRDLTDYITGDDDWIIGRNGDFPLIPLFLTTKLNDHLRRKYLL